MIPISTLVTATATAATATTAAAAIPVASWRTLFLGPRDIHGQRTAFQILAMKHFNGSIGLLVGGHLDKRKPSGLARELVQHQVYRHNDTRLRKILLQVVFQGLIRKVADKKSGFVHWMYWVVCSKNQWGDSALAGIAEVTRFGEG